MSEELPEIIVEIYPNVARLIGLDEATARRLFGHAETELQTNGRGESTRFERVTTEFLREPESDITTVPTCRIDEVEKKLSQGAFTTRRHSCSPEFASPVPEWVNAQSAWVRDCARSLIENPVGRISVRNEKDRKDTVTLVCDLFNTSNVVIVAPNRNTVQQLCALIDETHPGRATEEFGDLNGSTNRVLVCGEQTFILIDPGYIGVVIFSNLLNSLGTKLMQDTMSLDHHRIYAIEDLRKPLDSDQAWKAEYLAGRTIFSFDSLKKRCKVFDRVIAAPSGGNVRGLDALETKRCLIWENQGRNQIIAELAESLARGESGDRIPLPVEMKSKELRVAILVESPAHALILKGFLPSWGTLSRGEAPTAWTAPHRLIITRLWANSRESLDVDVLIRAEGDASPLNLPGFPPQATDLRRNVLLIDFDDGTRR